MMSVTPSSSKPPDPRWDYDIYVSFIGNKTSYDFLYYLFGCLGRNGIVTFQPPPPRGENIPTLAIQRSRNFMVVLSQDYLSSEYCLNELVEIVDRRNIKDHIFFSILYQLGPSDVQKRIETLEEAFPVPEGQFGTSVDQRMQGWRAALTEVMNSSYQILRDDANGSMGILKFVEEVLDVVCTRLIIPRNTLRMDSCVEMMTDFLNLGTSEIYILGMSCVDEITKETLIGVVYSQIHHGFERTSFISNISEISISPTGLFGLQEELLGDMGGNEVNIKNADEGISLIEEAIQGKRVLIVLDNVDELKQLHTLIVNSECFGPGSRVIAVSRDKQLRTELEAHGKHKVEDLHDWKSPQLFIWRASMMADPAKDFPDKKDHYLQLKNEGHDYEVKFDPDPNLDLSADRMEDFLNEVLQLKNKGHDYQVKFNSPANSNLSGEGSKKQKTLEPEEVVLDNEAFDMTRYYKPASQTLDLSGIGISSLPKSIFGLVGLKRLILRYSKDFVKLPPEVGKLEQLEVLDLEGTKIRDLPKKLRCLKLLELYLHHNEKLSTIPPSFFNYMPALQTLNLSWTRISSLPESIVRLSSLKRLDLRCCHDFVKLPPEVGKLEQLEVLDLEKTVIRKLPENPRCPKLLELKLHNNNNLRTIPPSFFDDMPDLQILNLSKTRITSLPESFVKLTSLKRLDLSYCHDFEELPPEVGKLEQLEVLDLEKTDIRKLPENPRCPKLLELKLHNNNNLRTIPPSFFDDMPDLQILNLSKTRITSLPESFVKLTSLKRLDLSYCHDFEELPPEVVGELKLLEVLDFEGTKIRDLPENLRCSMLLELNLSSTNISSLPKFIVKLVSLKRLILRACKDLVELQPEDGELEQLEVLDLEGTKIRDLPENLRCPMLLELYLHNNYMLRTIPPSFFNHMPALQTLNLSKTRITSLPESIVRLVSLKRLILSNRLLSKVGELKQLEVLELEGRVITDLHERVIDLEGKDIMHLPEKSNLMLLAMFLHNNNKLKTIPTSFFNYMPFLEVLNLSRTGIRSLPESIFRLDSLKILSLSYCHRFLGLSPKVGKLKRLEVLDLEGTEIMDLPKEIKELKNLTCLNLSFYGYMGDGSSVMESDAVQFPRGIISALSHLEELMISVNPDDKRWNACVENIVIEIRTLKGLKTLLFYFPRVELVSYYLSNRLLRLFLPSHFRFIVGHHVKRIMSQCPRGVELELERWERCLEYINGDLAIPEEIKALLQYSTAFFLERHATVKKLSDFGIENMKQLKCCVVGECNEVEVIIDEGDAHEEDDEVEASRVIIDEGDAHEEDDEVEASSGIVLGSLEYLCVYYMKNLRSIWEGPVQTKCLSLLKFLTLRTCPELTTIFTTGLVDNLCNLEDLTIDDCPSIKTLVSCEVSAEHKTFHFLPNLKKMSLHYMPGLVSISSGLHIAPRLESLSFYDCPNLKNLLIEEVSSKDLKKIEGETSWWEALKLSSDHPSYLNQFFVPINIEDC